MAPAASRADDEQYACVAFDCRWRSDEAFGGNVGELCRVGPIWPDVEEADPYALRRVGVGPARSRSRRIVIFRARSARLDVIGREHMGARTASSERDHRVARRWAASQHEPAS